jgi:hypothetical protein
MCLWIIFRKTFTNSLPVVGSRLIGRRFWGNLGSLPGFGKVITFASLCQINQWSPRKVPEAFKVKVTLQLTVSQSVSLGVEPHLGHMTRYYSLTVIFVGSDALSDERRGLSFVQAAGPSHRILSRVRVSRDSRPYFTS